MALFLPDAVFPCYRDLSAAFLQERGIDLLLLDIDNTLAPYEQPDPDEENVRWLTSLAHAGIRVAFLSNNHGDRVTRFNRDLKLPVRSRAHKPLPFAARTVMRQMGGVKGRTAMMGDQIFTDVLCAKLCGVQAFLVPPIKDRTDLGTRLKRFFERDFLRRFYKKHPSAPDIRKGSPLTAQALRRIAEQTEKNEKGN